MERSCPNGAPEQDKGQYLGKSPTHASSVGMVRNLTTGFISPQFHVIYDTRFETVSGGYEDNEAVASHIWDMLAQHQRENSLVEANLEQQPLPNLHRDWLSPEEREVREHQDVNAKVMRRLHRRDTNVDPTMEPIPETTPAIEEVTDGTPPSDSDSEEDSPTEHVPRRNKPQLSSENREMRRSQRLAGKQPQYMDLFCHVEGEGVILDIDAVSNVVQRDE